MSLFGPNTKDFMPKTKVTSNDRVDPHSHLAEIFVWCSELMTETELAQKALQVSELLNALEAVAVWLMEQGRPSDAVKVIETATHLNPSENRLQKCLAVALTAAGEHRRALSSWQRLCEQTPHDAENQLMLAQALHLSGDTSAARASFHHWFSTWNDVNQWPMGLKEPALQWYRWLNSSSPIG
jgi:predicted Zn-dependent protease